MKENISISFADDVTDSSIIRWLKLRFKEVTVIPILTETPDLLVFTGGEDVDPSLYNQRNGKYTASNVERDKKESNSFHRLMGVPKLGICRGAQFLTVMNQGRLIQHVENHKNSNHQIECKSGVTVKIPGDHHQMMFPYNLKPVKYEIIGWSKKYLSNAYLNGLDEQIELPNGFLEPEIVVYPRTLSYCIQSHPEWDINSSDSLYILDSALNWLFDKKEKHNDIEFDNYFNYEENDVVEEQGELQPEPPSHLWTYGDSDKEKTLEKYEELLISSDMAQEHLVKYNAEEALSKAEELINKYAKNENK